MTAETERTRERITKLLALARGSSSEAEAHSALLKAQELLLAAGIDAEGFGEAAPECREVLETSVPLARIDPWQRDLAQVVAQNFRVYTYRNGNKKSMQFVGLPADLTVAVAVYKAALESAATLARFYVAHRREDWEGPLRLRRAGLVAKDLEDLGEEFLNPEYEYSRWSFFSRHTHRMYHLPVADREKSMVRRSYLSGFVTGLRVRFRDQVADRQYGLMLVRPEELDLHIPSLGTVPIRRGKRGETLGTARADGDVAGRAFSPVYVSGQLCG